jgi:hypothetical protein
MARLAEEAGLKEVMMTTALWLTVPVMAIFFGLWTGVPLWMVLKHPDEKSRPTRTVPAYLRHTAA